ncbi:flagellar hook-associated protein FlgK [Falsiroseomonas sp. E2-1-a4]|uniref:flagellar hook-associated protein FlgK n=1 Tax=Falsiroseomonas sp. E2-1-a4 TaxID=3239299 RepID=UPI003F2ED3C9
MSLDLALSVATSGLRLLDRQMARAADDIANAGTVGHTRKSLEGNALTIAGAGQGVRANVITRDVDLAVQAALQRAGGDAAAAGLRERLLGGVEAAHGTPELGDSLGGLVSSLQSAFIELREAPADAVRRSAVVTEAHTLAGRLNQVSDAIGVARQGAHDALRAEVAAVNAGLSDVARLNSVIKHELAAGRSVAALEDERDLAIGALAGSLDLSVIRGSAGDVTLVARGGIVLPLVQGSTPFSLADATVGTGAFHGGAGTLPGVMLNNRDVTRQLAGGRMGAAAELRDATLPRMQAELDVAASQISHRLESQGLRLFTDAGGTVPDPTLPYAGSAMVGFAGAIRVNAAVVNDPALLRDGTHDVVGDPAGPSAFTTNPPTGPAGFATLLNRVLDFSFGAEQATGVAQPGFATGGLGPDGTLSSPLSGLRTLAGYGAALVAEQTGARAAATEAVGRATSLGELLTSRMNARSGVDVDAEVAAMVQLQTAYGVNARVISTIQAMWDSLFNAVR